MKLRSAVEIPEDRVVEVSRKFGGRGAQPKGCATGEIAMRAGAANRALSGCQPTGRLKA